MKRRRPLTIPPDIIVLAVAEQEPEFDRQDELARVQAAIARLPPLERGLVEVYDLGDRTVAEARHGLGITLGQFRRRQADALGHLRESLGGGTTGLMSKKSPRRRSARPARASRRDTRFTASPT